VPTAAATAATDFVDIGVVSTVLRRDLGMGICVGFIGCCSEVS
jgi:hypothetical protein